MSFSTQKMLLTNKPENEEEYGELRLTVDSSKYHYAFRMNYQGTLRIDYGDGTTETLKSPTSIASRYHSYSY